MRQLGARLPELPPVKTDVKTPPEIQPHERHSVEAPEPYPVEVHRIERRFVDPAPMKPQPSRTERIAAPPLPAEPVVEPPAATPLSETIVEPVAMTPSPEPIVETTAGTQAALEPIAEPVEVTQAPEPIAAPVAVMQPPEPIVETAAGPPLPEPIAEPIAIAQPPEPIAETTAMPQAPPEISVPRTEMSKTTSEQPLRQHVEPRPEPKPAPTASTQAPREPLAEPARKRPEPAQPRIMEVETVEPEVAGGRWAEFQEFRRLEPGRGSRMSLEPLPPPPLLPRGLLAADREPEHRSSFLTIAVPGIAAILAVGALLWSGSLRDRVLRQDAEMTALQEQNRKLADTLSQMNVDPKAAGTPSNPDSALKSSPAEVTQPQTAVPSGKANDRNANGATAASALNSTALPGQATSSAGKREGVSMPPSVQSSAQRRGFHPPADPGYHPEIVPPYPTVSQTQNTAQGTSYSPQPVQQAYGAPSPMNSTANPAASSTAPARTQTPSAPAQSPASSTDAAPSYGIGSSPAYRATGNGGSANDLAQNIEAVEGLQRQSQVPLREFHTRDGVQTKVTPGLFVSVRSPDQAHGTYALLVNGGVGSYQLRGYVNGPLAFVDNATHRGYQLVILRIAGQEVYGYIRPVR